MHELDAQLTLLRERGVAKATFDGESLTSVEFFPDTSSPDDEPQHDTPRTAARVKRPVGGLVPRASE